MLTAADILRIAECAENRTADFYRNAAGLFSASPPRQLCLELAKQSQRYAHYWSRTRAGLNYHEAPPSSRDDECETAFHPESMIALAGLGEGWRPQDKLTGRENEAQILTDCMRRLRNICIFYAGLKGFVRRQAGRTMIDRVVRMANRQYVDIERRLQLKRGHPSIRSTHPCASSTVSEKNRV